MQKNLATIAELESFTLDFDPSAIFLFMSPSFKNKTGFIEILNEKFPDTIKFGCSTSGEILGNRVFDGTVSLTAVHFEKTSLNMAEIHLNDFNQDSYQVGHELYKQLEADNLRHIMVLSDGLHVNGAELVKGLQENSPETVTITGGLAGDAADFKETFLICSKYIKSKRVIGLGFYGDDLKIGFGSKGGWDSFGLERLVTRSKNNILYELDGEPALELYKSFLGDKAKDLPGSGLLFPLSMRGDDNKTPVVRTILGIDEKEQSLTFAGDINQGSYVRLMKANVDRLIDGAEKSAEVTKNSIDEDCQLAFLISCVGRRLVLKQMAEDEIEAVNTVLGDQVYTAGFYSYGEIAPFKKSTPCTLHNQTMTITTFSE